MARSLEVLRVSYIIIYLLLFIIESYRKYTHKKGRERLLHFPTGGANDAQNVSVDTARGKDYQQNL